MTLNNVINFANSLGAHAILRSFGRPSTQKLVSIFVGHNYSKDGLEGFSHAIFVFEEGGGWIIGFQQTGKTRVLQPSELQELLRTWIAEPDFRHFQSYEGA